MNFAFMDIIHKRFYSFSIPTGSNTDYIIAKMFNPCSKHIIFWLIDLFLNQFQIPGLTVNIVKFN